VLVHPLPPARISWPPGELDELRLVADRLFHGVLALVGSAAPANGCGARFLDEHSRQ